MQTQPRNQRGNDDEIKVRFFTAENSNWRSQISQSPLLNDESTPSGVGTVAAYNQYRSDLIAAAATYLTLIAAFIACAAVGANCVVELITQVLQLNTWDMLRCLTHMH